MNRFQDKRKNDRLDMMGFISKIAFGNLVLNSNIADISEEGIKVTEMPLKFKVNPQKYITVVGGHRKNFKLVIQPRWFKKVKKGNYQEVGFKILQSPPAWTEFIEHMNS